MQYTSHYNLITVEGTDVVNPLVQMNPNFTDIDAAMFANKQASIGSATELTAGTVHAITRANPDSNYFKFTATSNWTAGDSMSIDGITVSVFLTDGTLPGTGAYVINSEVFGILSGTRVTLFLTNPLLTLPASDVTFNPAGTSLTATNADAAIKELDTKKTRLGTLSIPGVSIPVGLSSINIPIADIPLTNRCISMYTNYASSDVRYLSWHFITTSTGWALCINNLSNAAVNSATVVITYIDNT